MMEKDDLMLEQLANREYEFGFVTAIDMDISEVGLNEDTVKFISAKKNEPQWLLDWRMKGFKAFQKQEMPQWQNFKMPARN
ncbi:hypothetical protein [Pedobacter sp. NJ-S-72]